MDDDNDLIFDDDESVFDEPSNEPSNNNGDSPAEPSYNNDEGDDDLTADLLARYGIQDPSRIKFEDESGAIVERDWNELSRAEQLNMLTNTQEEHNVDDDLDEDEIRLLNSIRSSGMGVRDFLQALQPEPQQPVYEFDTMSDDDIFVLDLLDKVGGDNITDDEITQAVEVAKQNPDLFKKTVEGLRQNYIRAQQDEEQQRYAVYQAQQQQQYQNYVASIENEIRGLNNFAGQELELNNRDRDILAAYLLDLDENGLSQFGKDLNNPTNFTEAAFWMLNRDSIIQEINSQIQNSYKRGYAAAKQDSQRGQSRLVMPKSSRSRLNSNDDSWLFDD